LRCWSIKMRNQPPTYRSSSHSQHDNRHPLQNMATPRKPEPPKKMGFLGFILILGILAGLVWLVMLIFGLGPYKSNDITPTPTQALAQIGSETALPTMTLTLTTAPKATATATLTTAPTMTDTVTPTSTLELMPFVVKGGQESMSSALIRPELDAHWLVIAGQVWDLQEEPVIGLTLHLYGELAGYEIDQYVLTGSALAYGESGYEFVFENLVVDSDGSLHIQLVDTNGLPFSLPYPLQTFADEFKNLILMNFKQVR